MPWKAPSLAGVTTLPELKRRLVESLPALFQTAQSYEVAGVLPFGSTVRPNGAVSRVQSITVTTADPFTVANPPIPREGVEMVLDFHNVSGEDMGAVTFGSDFKLDGPFDPPTDAEHAVYTFVWVPA